MVKEKTGDALSNIRHTLAHVLAHAVLNLYGEKVKFGIGPVIETGFYYDFEFPHPLRQASEARGLATGGKSITDTDLPKIEAEMKRLIEQNLEMKKIRLSPAKVKNHFKTQPYKQELMHELKKQGRATGGSETTFYQIGEFLDLCRGGHVKNTSELPADGFKLTHLAGAYWKGDEKNPMLTRIYAAAFATKEELEKYLWQREEQKKRDHRILGQKLKLFTFADEVGPGLPLWLPHGTILREELEKYAKRVEKEWGYQRISTPHIAKEALYKMSGHIPYYAESMYPPMKLDDGNYYLKAMNCPHTHMIYRSHPRSYRDLPVRYAEFGTVYRYELSGTLAGLLRVRGFTTNDAHIYCTADQAEEEFLKVMKLHEFWYKKVFGIKDFYMRLSLPDKDKKKFVSEPKEWDKAIKIIRAAMKKSGLPFEEAQGEAAFYGPKVDFQIKSVTGREETASTNQLDFLAAKRFNLTYKDKKGEDKPVYVIHRAPLGSHERFIAFLIEHFAGAFPLWLAPVQIAILPINDQVLDYAKKIADDLSAADSELRIEIDERKESVGKKIRQAETQKIPYMLIVGNKEEESNTISVRARGEKDLGVMKIGEFSKKISKEIANKTLSAD